jgi:hypothetical protein
VRQKERNDDLETQTSTLNAGAPCPDAARSRGGPDDFNDEGTTYESRNS